MILVMSITCSFAQKKNVSTARNRALMETPDFKGARDLIKLALEDETTKNQATTWYVAGLIGYQENEAEIKKMMLSQKHDIDKKGEAIMESYKYFVKAWELDQLPNAKGKVRPRHRDIKAKVSEYFTNQANLVAYGAHLYEKKNFERTIEVFETYLGIPKLPMMNNELVLDSTYYMIKYYTAFAAINAKKNDLALKHLLEMKTAGYEENAVHQLIYQEYADRKDTVNYVKILKEGFERFPAEPFYLQNLINHYIFTNQSEEAVKYLNAAIAKEPTVAQYHLVKGKLDELMAKYDDARAAFDKAIELDPKLADAHAEIGRLFYNKAVRMSDDANNIKDIKLYNAERVKIDKVFAEAIPHYKKAIELNPDEFEYKKILRNLYYRLKMDKEYDALNKAMNE